MLIERQARELQALDRAKSHFFTNISHELRTPITLITAPIHQLLLKYGPTFEQSVENSLQLVLKNGQKLGRLVEELLELSRLEAKKATLKVEPTPIDVFCRRLFQEYASGAAMKHLDYTFHSGVAGGVHVLVDRDRVEKIINNLLSNALKFTPSHGAVRMDLHQKDDNLVIKVTDNGSGIPEADLPYLFDRYFQSNRVDNTRGGTGIGLALAKELANLMDGDITVESTWGKGATFRFNLPVQTVSKTADVLPVLVKTAADVAAADTTMRWKSGWQEREVSDRPILLIVEDNQDMGALLYSILSDAYICKIVNDGAEAWAFLQTADPGTLNIDLILSDVMMPKMDGYVLLEKVKSQPYWQQVPFILLTARAEGDSKLKALRMGVDDYLLKPFSPLELQARVANLIANYQVRKKLQMHQKAAGNGIQVDFETPDPADFIWLNEVEQSALIALEKGIKLTRTYLCNQVFLSDRQFSRKLQGLTGLSPQQYILQVKLQKARHLLEQRIYSTTTEVAKVSGFVSASYLAKVYREHYGRLPGEYL
jgi:DNA-binding response OmpR family regulator